MATDDDMSYKLGRIEGLLEGLDGKIDTMSADMGDVKKRLNRVEVQSAKYGGGAGGAAAVGVAIVVESIKSMVGNGT